MNKKLVSIAAAASLAVCAAVWFLPHPAPADPPAASVDVPDRSALHLNSIQPEESHTYVPGAVLYQPPFISSYFSDGGSRGTFVEYDGTLTAIAGEEPTSYTLSDTRNYEPETFRAQFPEIRSLLPEDAAAITCRTYQTVSIWEITSASGGTDRWASDSSLRLFALIDLDQALPFWANGALWTYDPCVSTILPIRFDFDADLTATSGVLSQDTGGGWSGALSVESGETVYWMPSQDGAPEKGAVLQYRSESEGLEDTLELRPVMDYQGLYGSKTYGISNNWLGLASSAIHLSYLSVDEETGELVIHHYDGDGPYISREIEASGCITVKGTSTPPQTADAQAAP